jgi:hypothetical protein
MLGMEAVEMESGHPVECSRRLLAAIHGGNLPSLKRELARAARVSVSPLSRGSKSSLVEEQTELLGAIVGSLHVSMQGYEPCAEADLFLLGHLAGATALGESTYADRVTR